MEHAIASHGRRLHTMSQDLAFVEQQLIRAMAEPQMDPSLSHTLNRLRELRGVVAGILAKHTEVASVWTSITAAARSQAHCLQYLQTLRAVAEANGYWLQEADELHAPGRELAELFWSRDFPFHNTKLIPNAAPASANHTNSDASSPGSALGESELPPLEDSRPASGQRPQASTVKAKDPSSP